MENALIAQQVASMTSVQKVAALLILLGPQTAAEVLKNITDNDLLEKIALEIASLNKVPITSLVSIFEEFRTLFQANSYLACHCPLQMYRSSIRVSFRHPSPRPFSP